MLQEIEKSLEVRAPISGYLSTIDAQVGQNITAGQRIGQIDLLDKLKVQLSIDQFYISRVQVGTIGHVNLDGKTWDVKIQKIYPEVKSGAFAADAVFVGETPESLKRGQTLTIELTFGAPSHTLIVSKGSFYQETSGRWVYLVSKDGRSAPQDRRAPRPPESAASRSAGRPAAKATASSLPATTPSTRVDELQFTDSINTNRVGT